jgi:hypothetical protein
VPIVPVKKAVAKKAVARKTLAREIRITGLLKPAPIELGRMRRVDYPGPSIQTPDYGGPAIPGSDYGGPGAHRE